MYTLIAKYSKNNNTLSSYGFFRLHPALRAAGKILTKYIL